MTDQELSTLHQDLESLRSQFNDKQKEQGAIALKMNEIGRTIRQENKRRKTESDMEELKKSVKHHFETVTRSKPTSQLWMVKINGETFRSNKGKYTWTSAKRACQAISNYIYYHNYNIKKTTVQLDLVVEELIKDGYIEVIQIY